MEIKRILVSQPEPANDKSPYFNLAKKNDLTVDFRPFIKVEGVPAKEFRQQKIDILKHTAVIFTSRTAVDHFFRISKEMKLNIPETMKYFCISEAIAFYLQKYIVYRKRKIFYGKGKFDDLIEVLVKNKEESFFVPFADAHKQEIPRKLKKHKLKFSKSVLYKTVSTDLSDLADVNYDILVFYSPSGIKSLLHNFPDFEQNNTKIASFGNHTAKAVKDAGLRLDIQAPMPKAPSMTMAIETYLSKNI
ncbi:MAG: uroporphyrinogen-III synthase [Bacteroidetes bacterium 4572_117]|nr:MAG: uroporphyrinogen-III synthase [Bacteroidetes bacterium 4572_117]